MPDNRRVEASLRVFAPAETVFAAIADHQSMTDWAGLGRATLDKTGHPDPAGRHAERVIAGPMGKLREQITEWRPNEGYRYRIIEGGPFVGHWGDVRLTPEGKHTIVNWTIRFRSRIPGLGWLFEKAMGIKLAQALGAFKRHVEAGGRKR